MCKNLVSQHVPRGYGYKEVKLPCGSTSIHGDQLLCADCLQEAEKMYPQGWEVTPGDICKHGVYVGDEFGPDYMCIYCETE